MKKFKVNFFNKSNDKKPILTVYVEKENDLGIILKGKIIARSEHAFKFSKRTHTCSFLEI